VSIATFQFSEREQAHPAGTEYLPNFDRQFMIGSTVVALVGPPAVGRSHIITTAAEMFPDDITPMQTPLDPSEHNDITVIGLVAEAPMWFHRFSTRFAPGTQARETQRNEALASIQWLGHHANTLPLLYNFDRRADITATELHDFLKGYPTSSAEAKKVLPTLFIAAETVGL
jgi:hypothetical protein